jgi:serine/threonine protein kinase
MDSPLDKFYLKAKSLNLKLPEIILSKVAFSVLSALEYLKRKNIMHRDVKPSNILINRDCTIKLCDFGFSGTMDDSVCIVFTGFCPYTAPEKIMDNVNSPNAERRLTMNMFFTKKLQMQ